MMLGVSFGTYGMAGVTVSRKKGRYVLDGYHAVPFFACDGIRDERNVLEQIVGSLGYRGKSVRVSLSPQYADLQIVRLKSKPGDVRELRPILCWKALGQKADPTDFVIDFQELPGEGGDSPATFVVEVIRKAEFDRIVDVCASKKLSVDLMDVDPLNVFYLFHDYMEGKGDFDRLVGLVFLGEQYSSLTLFDRGVFCAYRRFAIGGRDFTEEIMRKKNIPLEQAEGIKTGNVFFPLSLQDPALIEDEVLENFSLVRDTSFRLLQEIKASLISYSFIFEGRDVGYLYVSGGPTGFSQLESYLTEALGVATEMLNPLEVVVFDRKKEGEGKTPDLIAHEMIRLAPAIGACLRDA